MSGFAGAGDVTGCRLDCETATTVDSSEEMSAEADIVSKIVKTQISISRDSASCRRHMLAMTG